MTDKISKLCELLEDVDGKQSPATDRKKKQSIKLMIFQVEQRAEELERRVDDIQRTLVADGLGEGKDELLLVPKSSSASVRPSGEAAKDKSPMSPTLGKPAEGTGIRGMMAKHDMQLNEVNLRVADLENGMRKLEPNSMHALIKGIAELVMQEQKKEVSEEMNTLKGSQRRNVQLVEMLKDELTQMDGRFKQGIEKKLERKDLYLAKNQLRRKVRLPCWQHCDRCKNWNKNSRGGNRGTLLLTQVARSSP